MLRVAGSATPVIVSITADGANQPARAEGPLVCAEASVEELPAVHSAFDVFAFPTAGAGLCRWALEASAMKRPVLAADDMAGEVVESGNTGWVEPPADVEALAKVVGDLLDDPGHAAAMGASGRARVLERFDEDAVVERSLQVYRRLLRRRGIRWDGERAEV